MMAVDEVSRRSKGITVLFDVPTAVVVNRDSQSVFALGCVDAESKNGLVIEGMDDTKRDGQWLGGQNKWMDEWMDRLTGGLTDLIDVSLCQLHMTYVYIQLICKSKYFVGNFL